MAGTEFVQVSAILTPAQQQPQNPNNILLATTDSPLLVMQDYTIHKSLKSVSDIYGTTGKTYQMANAIFSQVPNILDGGGSLTIMPFGGVDATRSSILTSSLLTKITTFQAVTNGKIKITLGDAAAPSNNKIYDITNIDFSNVLTVSDIKYAIAKKINEGDIKIEVINDALKFTNLKYGAGATIVAEASTLVGTDLLESSLLDSTTFTLTSSVNASGETLVEAITRIQDLPVGQRPAFEVVLTNLQFELDYANNSYIKNTASYLAGIEKIFLYTYSSLNDTLNALAIKNADYNDCKLIYHKDGEVLEMSGGVAGLLFSGNTAIPSSSLTLNKKIITGCTPCLFLTDTHKTALQNAGVDYYIDNVGTPAYVSNKTNGGFLDDRYNYKIITLEFTAAYDNALNSATKIPQTQNGLISIQAVLTPVANKMVSYGAVGVGIKWNANIRPSSITSANFDRIIFESGYYIDLPNITLQSQADREDRKAPPITIYFQLAGAIHKVSSVIYIQR